MVNVCVIFGGKSSEHEVSLWSAASVIKNIDVKKYNVSMIGITKAGKWLHYTGPLELIEDGKWESSPFIVPVAIDLASPRAAIISQGTKQKLLNSQKIRQEVSGLKYPKAEDTEIKADVIFPVLHGKNGEDGTIQGFLEIANIPYVGCGVLASAACMDKHFTHIMLESAGILKTKLIAVMHWEMEDLEKLLSKLDSELGYPMFIKPANAGSSVGVTKVNSKGEILDALKTAFLHDKKVVAEKGVTGREIEVSVMGGEEPVSSKVAGEIAPENGFYDYNGKYLNDSTKLYVPADIDEITLYNLRKTAENAYRVMGCRGLARIDFFVDEKGRIILNEINTLPGFTSISMFPKLFEHSGIPYSQLIDKLITQALEG